MLPVGAGLAPDYRSGGVADRITLYVHRLAITLHVQLLQERGKLVHGLIVGDDRLGLGTLKIVDNVAQQTRSRFNEFNEFRSHDCARRKPTINYREASDNRRKC